MVVSVTCPHREEAPRECPGCSLSRLNAVDDRFDVSCNGEISGRVYRDTEGDAGVIGGLHSFWAVENEEATCGCHLTEAEWDKVREALCEQGSEPPDPADDLRFPY